MADRNDQDYPFIKETIKKRPVNIREAVHKLLMAAVCGIVFGCFAVATMAVLMPFVQKSLGKDETGQKTVRLSPPAASQSDTFSEIQQSGEDEAQEAEILQSVSGEASQTAEAAEQSQNSEAVSGSGNGSAVYADDLADHLENIYKEIKKIAQEPQKALVRVTGIGENQDLLDHSSLTYGDEEGIIFLKNEEAFYILTISDSLGEGENYRVVFSTGDTAEGTLCGVDSRSGLMVIRVSFDEVEEETRREVPAVPLTMKADQEQADPVIAIGSPTGDSDTLVYGNITSVQGRYRIADGEYTILTTDMVGSSSGGGVLLDMEGQMIGIIINEDEEDGNVIRAVSVAQLRPILEMLSNGESIRYLGILGETVTEEKSQNLEIPQGIYVDGVEENSPAMSEGIQSGDIVYEIGGKKVDSMEEYSEALQELTAWEKTKISLYRRNPSGEYVEVDLKIMVEEN